MNIKTVGNPVMMCRINFHRFFAYLVIGSSFLVSSTYAGPGHNHGAEEASTTPLNVMAAPRFATQSEQFELVGILEETNLHLYLDDYASNAPIENAKLELEINGETMLAEPEGAGEYHATLPAPLEDGVHALMVTVLTEQSSDLLIGELDVHTAHEEPQQQEKELAIDKQYLPWLLGMVGIFLLLVLFMMMKDRKQRGVSA
jgi:hypothetical protein